MEKLRIIIICFGMTFSSLMGQNGNAIINKTKKLDSVIELKKDLNNKIQNLRIQIYNGNRKDAESIMEEYIK